MNMEVYYLTPQFKYTSKIVLLISIIIQSIMFIFLFQNSTYFIIYVLVLSTAYFNKNLRSFDNEYIVISEYGIDHHRGGSVFEIQWKDVDRISSQWFIWGKHESLVLDHSKVKIREMPTFGPWYLKRSSQEAFIPIACFSENWRDSELGKQIKQHAPHLFNDNIFFV